MSFRPLARLALSSALDVFFLVSGGFVAGPFPPPALASTDDLRGDEGAAPIGLAEAEDDESFFFAAAAVGLDVAAVDPPGGDVEEVNFIGDDAMLLACAMDELARRGARRDRILMLSSEGRPCRAAEWQGVATAFLPDG